MRVLIAYASAHGSTRSVAERIAARLRERGLTAECLPMPGPGGDAGSLAPYEAAVLGSAIHNRAWLPGAREFVRAHADELAARPVWLFGVGMPAALARPLQGLAGRERSRAMGSLSRLVGARGTRLFSGVVAADQFPLVSRIVLRLMGGHYGDFRDWHAIDAWAQTIATHLLATASYPA